MPRTTMDVSSDPNLHAPAEKPLSARAARAITTGRLRAGEDQAADWVRQLSSPDFRGLRQLTARSKEGSEEALSSLVSLTTVLYYLEEGPGEVQLTDGELPDLLERLSLLVGLETGRRAGTIDYVFPGLSGDEKPAVDLRDAAAAK